MLNSLIKFVSMLFAPLLAAILPLHQALIILLILVLINYISQVIISFKNENTSSRLLIRLISSIMSRTALQTLFKRLYKYSLTILIVSLLDIYILGFNGVELVTRSFSLLHFTIVVAGCLEVTRGFKLGELITGNSVLDTMLSFLPSGVSKLLGKKNNNKDPQ